MNLESQLVCPTNLYSVRITHRCFIKNAMMLRAVPQYGHLISVTFHIWFVPSTSVCGPSLGKFVYCLVNIGTGLFGLADSVWTFRFEPFQSEPFRPGPFRVRAFRSGRFGLGGDISVTTFLYRNNLRYHICLFRSL